MKANSTYSVAGIDLSRSFYLVLVSATISATISGLIFGLPTAFASGQTPAASTGALVQPQAHGQGQIPVQIPAKLPAQTQSQSTTQPSNATVAIKADNLETSLRELHESLRRMKGDVDDILHEVTRTKQIYNNGVPVSSNPWSQSPIFMMYGGMTAQDALSHDIYLPPRIHWLNNSLAQLLDLQSKLQAESANINKLLVSPQCNSATRAEGFVLGDITAELGKDLDGLETLIREAQPSNAKINVAVHKIAETMSGMDKVGDRLWKEAPRGLKIK